MDRCSSATASPAPEIPSRTATYAPTPASPACPTARPAQLLDAATAARTDRTGWDLHELRHSGLTHLGEAGASLLDLMAKSRHRKPENLRRYFKPSAQTMRNITSLLGPDAHR